MTTDNVPNPFSGHEAVRIEKAVRRAVAGGTAISVGDVLISLRTDPDLSDDDFREFFRALLVPRLGFDVERWVQHLIEGARPLQ
jgi:hypothetical protein